MALRSPADSRRMYSWWWDSHISPKNSKWLQENLTGMDSKVKAMIKLIEEDADSFARRAEMYYKKRPELMRLVEDFYRAYRALAERYDHATGALRQAHKTMTEAFPNQLPMMLMDDSPVSADADSRTPESMMSQPIRAMFEPEDSFTEESSDSASSRKGLRQFNNSAKNAEGRVRKGLIYNDTEKKESGAQSHERLPDTEQMGNLEKEILTLKEALEKLKSEKEAGLTQYHQSLERISNLDSEVSRAQEDSRGLNERASKAEAEVQLLKEALAKLDDEKESRLLQHQQSLERLSDLENLLSRTQHDAGELNERANKAETQVQFLTQDLATVKAEKELALDQYNQSLEMIQNLEKKLSLAEEDARVINERAEKAENEVKYLKEALSKLTEEKEAAALEYHQCLETIFSLEQKLLSAQEEAQRLNGVIDDGISKLKVAEDQCVLLEKSNQSFQSELEMAVLKMGSQTQELTEKQEELGRLWGCIQDERRRFVEAETAFQTLQQLHFQAQEDLRSLAMELQNRAQICTDMETRNQSLQDEISKVKEENENLNELNLSSSMSIKDMQGEILSLRDTNGKLEEEVDLRVDQRNALQQEIYCLKEELSEMNKKHRAMVDQVDAVGFDIESFGSSVKELQEENSILNENFQRERSEKLALLEKLEIMQQLLEKNSLLEISLSDLSEELEGVKGKIKALEESYQSLFEEKSTLISERDTLVTQLQVANENVEKLSEKNTFLDNSLSDNHDELEGFKAKTKSLEGVCQLLDNEKSGLINQNDTLSSQLNSSQQHLVELEKRYAELEEKFSWLEKEKESTTCRVKDLMVSLETAKNEHMGVTQLIERRLAGMETQICLLQEEGGRRKREFEEELDKAFYSEVEIFVLQRSAKDLEEKNLSLLNECQNFFKASKFSEKLISELHQESHERKGEMKSLFDQTNQLNRGMNHLLKALNIDLDHMCEDSDILRKLEETKTYACKTQDENQQLAIQVSVLLALLGQLRLEATKLKAEKNDLDQEVWRKTEQVSLLQSEACGLLESNEGLKLKVREGYLKEETLKTQIENLEGKVLNLQQAYQNIQEDNSKTLEEKCNLMKEFSGLEEKNSTLEGELSFVFGENLFLSGLLLIYENFLNAKAVELKEADEDIEILCGVNKAFEEKLGSIEIKLEENEMENFLLRETLKQSEEELKTVASVNDQLSCEISNGNDLLLQKEVEFSEKNQNICALENEKSELQKVIEYLKRDHDEAGVIMKNLEKQIVDFSEENGLLNTELHKGKNEIDVLESEAAALFGELQFSNVCLALYEEKIHDLGEAYESLKNRGVSRDMDSNLLREKISILEAENGGLKTQLAAYVPTIMSLRDCISSLENNSCLNSQLQKVKNDKSKDSELTSEEGESAIITDANSDLQDLVMRVQAIEKAVVEMEKENHEANSKAEAAMKQIEDLKSKNSSSRNKKPMSEISQAESELLTKDIMISECSSYEHVDKDSQMIESWETSGHGASIDLTVGKSKKKFTDHHPKSEVVLVEDKLEIPKKSMSPREGGSKKKVLERLNSDIQKLTNLRITVQDLKNKMEITEKSKKGKTAGEHDDIKVQIEEAEEAIMKLCDLNAKLTKNIEDGSLSPSGKFSMEGEEIRRARRRKISEQARRVSEKIGRLQLEIQKIQFILLKLDEENAEIKGRSRNPEMKRRVLLRDYLYGAARTPRARRKKTPFCGCVNTPSSGE